MDEKTEPAVEKLDRDWVRGEITAADYFAAIRKNSAEQGEREAERALSRLSSHHAARHAAAV